MLKFASTFQVIDQLQPWSDSVIKNEPMLFSASLDYARTHGGPITHDFITKTVRRINDQIIGYFVIDSRVSMLMPGWYPCIPGWHLDDVPRTRIDGQPDHTNPQYKAKHVMGIVGGCSLTQFINDPVSLHDVAVNHLEAGESIYGRWNKMINYRINNPTTSTDSYTPQQIQDRDIVAFDWQSFHRGMPATANGWRFFIRLSYNTGRKIVNEIRRQTQIYLPAHEAGW